MRVKCTATTLIVRNLPSGSDDGHRLRKGDVAVAVGASWDGEWFYVVRPEFAGWCASDFLEEIKDDASVLWVGCHANNYRKGRPGNSKIDMIVIHVIEGSLKSCDSWFNNAGAGVSAHYGIGLNREIHQYVKDEDTAYHAGRVDKPTAPLVLELPNANPNNYSIGIEHEGKSNSIWPDTMYEDSARLVATLAKKHGIPLDRRHVVGHREIYSKKTCPGRGDVDRIVRMAREISL